jgi:hypothetical protein
MNQIAANLEIGPDVSASVCLKLKPKLQKKPLNRKRNDHFPGCDEQRLQKIRLSVGEIHTRYRFSD